MSTLTTYNGLQVVTPTPTGSGGLAINNNFKALSTAIETTNPTASNDNTESYAVGSRWYNTSSSIEWICTDASTGAAVWAQLPAIAVMTADPTSSNDSTQGFAIGSLWFNSTDVTLWICTNPTGGSAVWIAASGGLNFYTANGTIANLDTLTVTHPSDPSPGRHRIVTAYQSVVSTGIIATPAMTGYTTPSGTVTCSSDGTAWFGAYFAWNAFDQNNGTQWYTQETGSGWLQYQFPAATAIAAYTIVGSTDSIRSSPKNWSVLGSNDGSTWTTLDSQSNISWSLGQSQTFTFGGGTATYVYYQLSVSNNNGDGYLKLCEFQLLAPGATLDESLSIGTSNGIGVLMNDTSTVFTNNTGSTILALTVNVTV